MTRVKTVSISTLLKLHGRRWPSTLVYPASTSFLGPSALNDCVNQAHGIPLAEGAEVVVASLASTVSSVIMTA